MSPFTERLLTALGFALDAFKAIMKIDLSEHELQALLLTKLDCLGPGGTGTQLQARAADGTFQGITGSSWNGTELVLPKIAGAGSFSTVGNVGLSAGYVCIPSDAAIVFGNGTNPFSTADVYALRDTSGVLALRNGVNSQAFRVYSTYTDASNWERLGMYFDAGGNGYKIEAEKSGSGANRNLILYSSYGAELSIGSNLRAAGNLIFLADNVYDIGQDGANRPRDIYAAGRVVGQITTTVPVTEGSVAPTHYFHVMTPSGTSLRVPCEVIV